MPVPVRTHQKPSSHRIIKHSLPDNGYFNPFNNLTSALPVAPTGPPPAFGTRQQWIDSLPSWRRTKPRRIWEDESCHQDFPTMPSTADASLRQSTQARMQPIYSSNSSDEDLNISSSPISQRLFDTYNQWSSGSPDSMATDVDFHDDVESYERGAFTPIFEDRSPADNSGSSPIEPLTPFGDYIDRAVAATDCSPYTGGYGISAVDSEQVPYAINKCGDYGYYQSECHAVQDEPKEPTLPQEVVTPSANSSYKKLAEPLAAWIANYVWKACTTESGYPYRGTQAAFKKQYAHAPPEYLAPAIQSLLLSTLLQPSAVFLALWYIVRLPISFGDIGLVNADVKEARFRMALLGASDGHNIELMEASAPFRLTVLGCMLANKWLDDHTFSNKTWHTISNVPIHALNHLESLALDIFSYDLNISNAHWSQWLMHMTSFHSSFYAGHPQPISRPSANPLSIIRKAIDEIVQAPAACNFDPSRPQPIFVGLEERLKERLEREQAMSIDVADFDIDAGGPLREEYIPKRRISGAGSMLSDGGSRENARGPIANWARPINSVKGLPPPAKWSPAGDEPILRDRNRGGAQYFPVQPPAPYQVVPSYSTHDGRYQPHWSAGYMQAPIPVAFAYDVHPLPVYGQHTFAVPVSHSRSQSHYSYQDTSEPHNHLRSHSQSHVRCADMRMAQNPSSPLGLHGPWDRAPQVHAPAFAPHPAVNYPSAWLRT